MATDVPVFCGDVLVSPSDLAISDAAGVTEVPPPNEAEVLEVVLAKIQCESSSFVELRATDCLHDINEQYGVL